MIQRQLSSDAPSGGAFITRVVDDVLLVLLANRGDRAVSVLIVGAGPTGLTLACDIAPGTFVLVRPDGHLGAVSSSPGTIRDYLAEAAPPTR